MNKLGRDMHFVFIIMVSHFVFGRGIKIIPFAPCFCHAISRSVWQNVTATKEAN